MTIAAALMARRVRDCMAPAPPGVDATARCADAVDAMIRAGASSAVVRGPDGRLCGILTERDVARRVTFRMTPDAPVTDAMTTPVRSVGADERLYAAIGVMRRFGLRHMPVVDTTGRAVGMLNLHDAVAAAADETIAAVDTLTGGDGVEGLASIKREQAELAAAMIEDGVPCADIQALITHVNGDLYRRTADEAVAAMVREGLGEPPVPFAVIVMGSGGRGESYLFPDQDNGFVIADYPDSAHDRIDGFFIDLAERMTAAIDAVGFPYCKGGVMATNPVWRKTLSQWREQTSLWARRRSVVAVRLGDIFFDFQPVCGDAALAGELRRHVTRLMRGNITFLREMERDQARYGTALGLFGRLRRDRAAGPQRGQVDLKRGGTLPAVNAVRLLALRDGVAVTPTLARIAALREIGTLGADEAEELAAAFRHIAALVLRRQIEQVRRNLPVGGHVPPGWMSRREKRLLVDGLRAVERLQNRIAGELSGDVLTGGEAVRPA